MELFLAFLNLLEFVLLAFIGVQVLYFFVFSFASLFKFKPEYASLSGPVKIALIVPAYKEDRIILSTAKNLSELSYPADLCKILIAADQLKPETIAELRTMVDVVEVQFEKSTKAKSVNKALTYLTDFNPEIVSILDADNHVNSDFVEKITEAYASGHQVLQAHRTAKNKNSSFAILDAMNEEIGNSIFRKGHRVLGVSSALIGSGMAFNYIYFKRLMADMEDIAAEDKLLEFRILKEGRTIHYLPQVYVYDEKVSKAQNFSKQRTRWVGSQFYFARKFFFDGFKEFLLNGNFDYFDKAFQMILIPKVLLIGFLGIMGVLSVFSGISDYWLVLMLAYFIALLIAVPRKYYNAELLKAIVQIPKAIVFMILALLRIRKVKQDTFEVTEKTFES